VSKPERKCRAAGSWLLAALYCAGIYWQSSRPVMIPGVQLFPGQDKLAHMIMFGVLAVLVFLAGWRSGWRMRVCFLTAALFATLYGVSDELHQYFVPGRTADVYDVLADGAGAVLAPAVLLRWLRKRDEHLAVYPEDGV
jgi:VanZ family protein